MDFKFVNWLRKEKIGTTDFCPKTKRMKVDTRKLALAEIKLGCLTNRKVLHQNKALKI